MTQMDPGLALARLTMMVQPSSYPVLPPAPDGASPINLLLMACRRVDSLGYFYTDAAWKPTYDLNWGAAEAFRWKAAMVAGQPDFDDGQTNIKASQVHAQLMRQAQEYAKRSEMTPQSIRSQGSLIVNRQGMYSLIPWWYELAGN